MAGARADSFGLIPLDSTSAWQGRGADWSSPLKWKGVATARWDVRVTAMQARPPWKEVGTGMVTGQRDARTGL